MNFKKPKFWDLKRPNLIAYILLPFTIIIFINNILLNLLKKKRYKKIKIYGDGKAGKRILNIILNKKLNIHKKISYLNDKN